MKHLKLFFALFAMLALGVGNAWAAEVESYSATFTSVTNHSYTQNKTFTLNGKSWTASVSQVASSVFYLGCNSKNASKGILANNSTFAEIVTALKSVDAKYSSTSNAHAYALLFDNAYDNVTKVNFAWSGGNNAFQVYLFGYTNSAWVLLGSTNYATSGTNAAGSVEWTGTAANYAKFAVVARPGATNSTASNKTLRAKSFKIYTDDTPVGATKYAVTIDPNIQNGTVTADVAEAAEDATVTLTATPNAGYKFGAWDVKDASSYAVSVDANGKFTMPASDVTVSASFVAKTQYTIKWNVAEGSVADTYVYEGDVLGTLPTADNCSSGKVFVGWTEATSVNADGSGITYAKSTDVPAGNKEYNAVYATEITTGGGGATKYVKATTISDGTYLIAATNGSNSYAYTGQVTGKTYGGYTSVTISDDEIATKPDAALEVTVKVTDGKFSMHDGTSYLYLSSDGNNLNFIATEKTDWILDDGKIKNTAITSSTRYLQFNSASGSERFACYKSTQKDAYLYKKGDGSSISYIDYSLDCEAHQDPFLTIEETSINFGTVAQNATATETLNVSGGYLAEDVTLTISGTNASFFSVNPTTIAKADEVDQDITITYNPTATGDHTATLTIKTGDITKTVALSGTVLAPGKWALVTDASQLNLGDEIIIVAADANVALSTTQNTNNRGQVEIVKVGNTVNAGGDVQILTLGQGTVENTYAFSTGRGYLYAAGTNSNNHLKTKTTLEATGSWAITIDNATGVATIKAQDSNTKRNWLRYNATNNPPIFSCYESGQKDVCVYRNTDVIAAPIISGNVDFTTETLVTITAQNGLTVYYTTNGSTPDKTATQYSAPFTISATTTVKAIAYDATEKASNVAEKTFTKQELVNVATAMALAKDEIAYFDEFEVVKVVAGKGNIYIKDASGHGLIYDNTLAGQLKDGDRVQGFVGISSPYNGLPEAKPHNVTYEDLTITTGTPAQPYDFTSTAIAETDINKYIVFQNVEIATEVSISDSEKEFSLTIGGNSVKFYNQFGVNKTLEAGKTYDIYGFVAVYEKDGNRTLQAYFYEAVQDGEVIKKYTVTYNAGGATGTVPVDNAEYSEGAQVYLKSATSLTYEGYEYKGWKVTDENGTEIPVASNKFNMPASNVTVTAQWEEIVVAPRQDFSAGLWVLVTDASELAAKDYIIVAAAEENFAMKSYESGNNCKQVAITKFGNNNCFLTWTEEIGVFQLLASGSNYTIQDVNTKDYLYAAGSGSNNYLKANDEVPTDADAAKPYIWTISYTDGVATVKATSENRNTLMYNTSSDLFACYASGQKAIAIYKYTTDFYTRDVTDDNYGTICLPYGSSKIAGAEFYEVSSLEVGKGLWLDELAAGTALAAGKPYIFKATADKIVVAYEGAKQGSPVAGIGGLTGTFTDIAANTVLVGHYIIADNKIWIANDQNTLPANRAYIANTVPTTEQPQLPGRRRVCMGENATTGFDQIVAPEGKAIKVIENGQLIIIRDGVKYNVQGQKL